MKPNQKVTFHRTLLKEHMLESPQFWLQLSGAPAQNFLCKHTREV